MSEDWRISVQLEEEGLADRLLDRLRAADLADETRERLGDRVVISRDDSRLFLYTDTRDAAEEAERVVRGLLAEHELEATVSLSRWHDVEERWEDPEVPLPETPEQAHAEHEALEAREAELSRSQGSPEWEVCAVLPSHRQTVEFADRLEREGLPVTRRWRYLLVGAETGDEAETLAERLTAEAPERARIWIEGSEAAVSRAPRLNPFAFLGGLAN